MKTSARFWDRIAKRYSRQPVADEAAYQRKLDTTRTYFRPDMEVLEIACGTGSTAIAHAPYVKHVHAIDISSKMIEIARAKAQASAVSNVSFECLPIDEFNAAAGSLDGVLAMSIMHLVEDKDAVARSVHRWLKPGGVFVTSTVCLGETMQWFKLVGPVGAFLGLIPMVKVFTPQAFRESLTAAGFEIDHEWQPKRGKAVFIVARKPVP